MPTTIELVDFEDLIALVPSTPLGNAGIDLSLVKAQVKVPFDVDAGPGITFGIEAGTELTMTAFNNTKSDDPDRILGKTAAITPSGELPPQVMFDTEHAWLKYRVQGRAGVSAAIDGGWFAVGGSAAGTVVTGDYRRHKTEDLALFAIENDVKAGPRFALSRDHVLGMAPGDALTLQIGGELTAKVSIAWTDVFTSQLGTLTRAIATGATIGIKATAGAKITASVGITDQFVLVFSRIDDSRWRLGLKKGDVKQVDFGAEAGVTVEISNPDEITRLLNDFLSDLLGKPFAELQALLAKSSITQDDIDRFADVFRRLGLGPAPTLTDVKQASDNLEASVMDRVKTLVKEKIAAGFAYEYRRVSTDTTLLQATLTMAAVEAHHSDLKRGVLSGFVTSALQQPSTTTGPIVIEQYLNEKMITTEKAWGFTLGIGKWKVTGRDRRNTTRVRRLTIDKQHEQRSYIGLAEYTGEVFGEKQTWNVDVAADMPRFSVGQVPRFSEFQLGLNLAWMETNRKFDRADIDQAADFATIWAICGANDAEVVKTLLEPFRDVKAVDWSAHLHINDEAFRSISRILAAADRTQFAGPMAAAMRGRDAGFKGILDSNRRRTLYEPVWAFYLGESDTPDASTVSLVAQNALRSSAADSASAEQRFREVDPMVTAAGTCDKNRDTRSNADDFLRGIRALAVAIDRNDTDLDTIPQAYKAMAKLWTQSHHVRMLGVRIIDVARQVNQLKGVERTLTVAANGKAVTISSNPPGTV